MLLGVWHQGVYQDHPSIGGPYHNSWIRKVFHLCVSSCAYQVHFFKRNTCHTGSTDMASNQCVLSGGFKIFFKKESLIKMIALMCHIRWFQDVFFVRKSCQNGYGDMVSPQCVSSGVYQDYPFIRMEYKGSVQCVQFSG